MVSVWNVVIKAHRRGRVRVRVRMVSVWNVVIEAHCRVRVSECCDRGSPQG